MRWAGGLVLLCVALCCWGCSTISVSVDYDREADFSRYKSFDWIDQTHRPPPKAAARHTLLDKRLKDAVEAELRQRGYTKAAGGQPDFLIAYHIGAQDKIDVTRHGYRYGPHGRWAGHRVEVHRYKEGTLVLDFVDRGLGQLVWRGTAVGALKEMAAGPEEVRGMISRLLAQFPPQG